MQNFVKEGNTLTWTSDGTYSSGDMVVIGDRTGIVTKDCVASDVVELLVEGVCNYAYDQGATVAVGDKLYYDSGSDKLTKTSSSNKPVGWAAEAGATAALSDVDFKFGAW